MQQGQGDEQNGFVWVPKAHKENGFEKSSKRLAFNHTAKRRQGARSRPLRAAEGERSDTRPSAKRACLHCGIGPTAADPRGGRPARFSRSGRTRGGCGGIWGSKLWGQDRTAEGRKKTVDHGGHRPTQQPREGMRTIWTANRPTLPERTLT
jgi:hypothetical protein